MRASLWLLRQLRVPNLLEHRVQEGVGRLPGDQDRIRGRATRNHHRRRERRRDVRRHGQETVCERREGLRKGGMGFPPPLTIKHDWEPVAWDGLFVAVAVAVNLVSGL